MSNLLQDLPPPYSQSATAPSDLQPQFQTQSQSQTQSQHSIFSPHLASLRNQLASAQAARLSIQDQTDNHILALLIPHVEHILSSISQIHPSPFLVEATLVPTAAVDESWLCSDHDENRAREVKRIVRISDFSSESTAGATKRTGTDKTADAGIPFGRWSWVNQPSAEDATTGAPTLWWADEDMATRLARHLQPVRPAPPETRQPVGVQTPEAQEVRRASRWGGLFGKTNTTPVSNPDPVPAQLGVPKYEREPISMTVEAEEVTFRKENNLGLWESKRGWGIVVRVRIRQGI